MDMLFLIPEVANPILEKALRFMDRAAESAKPPILIVELQISTAIDTNL